MSASTLSKEFFTLVKAIGESKSKQEEDRIIIDEVTTLKKKMQEPSTSKKKMRELLVRLIYVEMLGHDGSFGYIRAVELCASTNLLQKRVGYLTASLVLSPEHDFRFMLVNQFQRDMASINHLEAWAALTALSKLVTVDMIPALSNDVVRLLKHDTELVRKKAVMALHRFHQLSADTVEHLVGESMRRALCDKHPSVMAASLCLVQDVIARNPKAHKDLVSSLVSILKQVIEHRLPREFDYHRIPAPWVQMKLLQILAILGHGDQSASEGMYEILVDVMKRCDSGINVGYAILYECVRTVTWIYPNTTLLDQAAVAIARFVASENHNLKYLGINGLAELVKDHPKYAAQHQMAVIECLEDPDDTIRRKTLDLLYRMINPVNVEFIVEKLLSFLEGSSDEFLRKDLVGRITTSAERYAPDNTWYVRTMTSVFETAGDLVQPEVAHNLMALIAEGSGEDEELDHELRRESVEHLTDLLFAEVDDESTHLHDILIVIIAWVLGEYGTLIAETDLAEECGVPVMMDKFCAIAERPDLSSSTRAYIISALMKLCAQTAVCPTRVSTLIDTFSRSSDLDVQQRCVEFLALVSHAALMPHVLPMDASCEDLEEEGELSFLDDFVNQALANGAAPYNPPDDEDDEEDNETTTETALKFERYEAPTKPAPHTSTVSSQLPAEPVAGGAGGVVQPQQAMHAPMDTRRPKANAIGSGGLNGAVSGPWGAPAPQQQQQQQQPSQTPPPVPSPVDGNSTNDAPAPPPAQEPSGPRELTEKEKQAALLFGGLGDAQGGSSRRSGVGRSSRRSTRPKSTSSASNVPTTVVAAAEPSLLDTNGDDVTHESAAASVTAPPDAMLDLLDISGPMEPSPTPQQPAMPGGDLVDLLTMDSSPAMPQQQAQQQPSPSDDPFSAAGLIEPMAGLMMGASSQSQGFMYKGQPIQPLTINTPQFGSKWTGMAASERKAQIHSASMKSPENFTQFASQTANLYVIQVIHKTMEAILAGQASGTTVCVHVKMFPGLSALQVTVRSGDIALAEQLLQHFVSKISA